MNDRPGSDPADRPGSPHEPPKDPGWSVRADGGGRVVALSGDWIAHFNARSEQNAVATVLEGGGVDGISFDSRELGRWDSGLLVFVAALRQAARERDIRFDVSGLPEATGRLLTLISEAAPVAARGRRPAGFVTRMGQSVIHAGGEAVSVTTLIGDSLLSLGTALRGRVLMRGIDLLECMRDAGVAALPIVTVVNMLIGGIVAFVGAVQLHRFGADVFIADLVGVAMVREMVALMTAIIMSGRTGGAYAAHIATMQGNEEIDALRTIGIPVNDYLILPRILALTGMMPMLYLYGCAVGVFGGFIVAVAMLNISPQGFIDETRASIALSQVLFGLIKSVAFGALIAIAGCRCGLSAGRSAADVGQAATRAVVIGIVGVIALDAVFAVCANALDF